ncbi:hypothetical protein LMH87_001459 [Akanthomyces muscarius]|uniref:Uncharacterized protein n=1 Tax=Akanthomyces muscarius TaxID=2231603 RepID=A0A9W8Q6C7_AKAMU|nr:hypothetical protein LMH87_001459 [Akanthomyces muscarius]KAJ4146900.1 hypothetical protein LMH87_001459 [Akanthomyces muscarius]
MQARQSNGLQSRRNQLQQRGAQNFWLRSAKPAPGNAPRYGPPHTQLYQASGAAPGAAALQEGARPTGFQDGHGAGTGFLPMADTMMSAAPPSDASPENVMSTLNQLKSMMERMRQEKGPEEDQPFSYLPSASQGGDSAAVEYDNPSQEMDYFRKELENCKKEVAATQQELGSVKRAMKQLEEANNNLKKKTTESLESLRDQLSLLLNACPLPEDDPFAYPPLPSS